MNTNCKGLILSISHNKYVINLVLLVFYQGRWLTGEYNQVNSQWDILGRYTFNTNSKCLASKLCYFLKRRRMQKEKALIHYPKDIPLLIHTDELLTFTSLSGFSFVRTQKLLCEYTFTQKNLIMCSWIPNSILRAKLSGS